MPEDLACLILRKSLNPLASGVGKTMMRHFARCGGVILTLRKVHRSKGRKKIIQEALKHALDMTLVATCSMRTLLQDQTYCGVKAFKLAKVRFK